jgi:hypothetical protein
MIAAEVADEVLAGVVGDNSPVALHAHEADVVEHVLERFVALREGAQRLVEHATIGLRRIAKFHL